jgi:hypothetical protein
MNIGKVTFSVERGCLVEVDGWTANIETKPAMLKQGVCHVAAVDAAHSAEAEEMLYSPCGQDGTVYGCPEPELVELAARYADWLEGRDEAGDETVSALRPEAAVVAVQRWMARQA